MHTDHADERFVCAECRGTIPINPQIRRALVQHGCALCGASIPTDTFC